MTDSPVARSSFTIQPVRPQDVPAVVAMVHELATYERAPQDCHLTVEQLHAALFGASPALFGHVAFDGDGAPIGMMLWFLNFSTWEGTHGIYLEDLYVRPGARSGGVGTAMLATLAAICVERGYRRLEWWMIDWNPAAAFYASIRAQPMSEWVPYRLTGDALAALASGRRPEGVESGRSGLGAQGRPVEPIAAIAPGERGE